MVFIPFQVKQSVAALFNKAANTRNAHSECVERSNAHILAECHYAPSEFPNELATTEWGPT